jgi:hypothetical protein
MIDIQNLDSSPMRTGDSKRFTIHGDGPFMVSSRCFVDKPRPPGPGFLPCPECARQTVLDGGEVVINSSQDVWTGRQGHLEIHIENLAGESRDIRIVMLPDSDSTPHMMMQG